jgi:streptogramin lyase
MNTKILACVSLGLFSINACGGDGSASDRGGGDSGIGSGAETGDGNDSAEGADTGNTGEGDDDPNTGDGDGDPSTGDGDGDGDGVKWDVNAIPDGSTNCGAGGGNNDFEFSFLWAANSSQGTISKIDTKTVTEVGRFIVRPDSNGSPSRTSVSLSGHVAVANRNGGVTKIYADEQFCQESNGMPGIQTSTNNVALPWGTEECVAWYKQMAYQSQRPVAWGQGIFNNGTCQWEQEELWTAGTNQQGAIDVYVLDGDTGNTKEMLAIPTGGGGLVGDFYGIYGAAVDGNGDLWGSQLGSSGKLVRVNRSDMTYDIWDTPNGPHWYGMTVDSEGYVWLCSGTVGRFDPQTQTWATAPVGGYTGCMADASDNGLLWMSTGGGVVGVNRDTLQVEKNWPTGGSYGVSIDFEGYVWTVAFGNNAHKIDPDTGQVWTYGGLVGAYTYSDMTGYALSNAGTPNG